MTIYALHPVRLEFDHFPEQPEVSYFRLLTSKHPDPVGDASPASHKAAWGKEKLDRYDVPAGGFAFFPDGSRYERSEHKYKGYQSSMTRSEFRKRVWNPRKSRSEGPLGRSL